MRKMLPTLGETWAVRNTDGVRILRLMRMKMVSSLIRRMVELYAVKILRRILVLTRLVICCVGNVRRVLVESENALIAAAKAKHSKAPDSVPEANIFAEYGTETAFAVKKKLPTAARGTKSAEDRAQNDKAGGRPRGGKPDQNEDASTKNDRKQCRTHYKEGKATVAEILSRLENGAIMKKPELRAKVEGIGLNFDGMMKWYQEQTSSKKPKSKTTPMQFPRSEKELRALFRGPEEKSHPWMSSVHIIQERKEVLWRVYDHASQGVIRDQDIGMVAGGCTNLNSVADRKKSLALHADWGNRKPTPFISFGLSLEHIQSDPQRLDHIVARAAKKKPADTVMITQVSVNARLEEGRPILNALTELHHYCREKDYDEKLYGNQMLLPFQVHPEEIVWNWNWKHIKKWMVDKDAFNDITKWENAIAKPAYQVHEQARLEGKTAKLRRKAVNDFLQGNMKYAALIEEDL